MPYTILYYTKFVLSYQKVSWYDNTSAWAWKQLKILLFKHGGLAID